MPPQGYKLRLSDIGCLARQQIVLRPIDDVMQWELYGNPNYRHRTPLTNLPVGGQAFTLEAAGVVVQGRLVSRSPSQAVVALDSMKLNGENVCNPGQYTIPAE